jgi:hypothetical protein
VEKGRRKMYRTENLYEGEPAYLYRSPSAIKNDIREITLKIKEAEDMLNIRSLLMDMLSAAAEQSPKKWIPEIEEVVAEAAETLAELRALKDSLDELYSEWREAKCVSGI